MKVKIWIEFSLRFFVKDFKKSWAQSLLWVMVLLSFYRSWDLGDILISWIGGEINVHPRSAGSAVLDSKPINHNHFVLGPFLYCFSNKKHKLALEGEKYQTAYTIVYQVCAMIIFSTFPEKSWLMWIIPNLCRN